MSTVTFRAITPLVPTGGSLAEAVAYYTQHLGFEVVWRTEGMAGVARDGIALNLVENANRDWLENASFSIGLSGLDALYAEYRNAPGRVGPLEVKPWGRREFHLIAPSGVCFQFYEAGGA